MAEWSERQIIVVDQVSRVKVLAGPNLKIQFFLKLSEISDSSIKRLIFGTPRAMHYDYRSAKTQLILMKNFREI